MGTPRLPSVDSDSLLLPPAVMSAVAGKINPYRQNFEVSTIGKARSAIAGMQAGSGAVKVLCIGDSTTAGYGASVLQSYPRQLVNALSPWLPAAPGLAIPPREVADSRWALNGWPVVTTFGWADSLALVSNGPGTGLATFTPGIAADTFDVYYFGTGGYGTLHIELDTGEKIDVNTADAGGSVRKATVTAAAATATHVVNLYNPSAQNVAVLGIDAYVAASQKMRIGNAGVSGTASSQWAASQGAVNGSGSAAAIRGYAPDLTIIMLGINDAKAGVSVEAFLSNLAATCAAGKASGSVILMSPVPSNTSDLSAREQAYQAALPAFAQSQGVAYVDVLGRFESYAASQPLGMYSDGLHPSIKGYADIAQVVATAIRAL